MPTTANNETLERIKKDATAYVDVEAGGSSTDEKAGIFHAYKDGATTERDKAIDEAIQIASELHKHSVYPDNAIYAADLFARLRALKSDITRKS